MSKILPVILGSAIASGSSYELPPATTSTLGGVKIGEGLSITSDGTLSSNGDLEPIMITAESNTTINGYQVPALTSANVQAIYNGIVAGKEVVVTDATENMHFKVNQADTVSDEIFIQFLYFNVMILEYNTNGSITYKKIESLPAGGTTGQVLKKTSGTDYAVEWGDAAGGKSNVYVLPDAINDGTSLSNTNISVLSDFITAYMNNENPILVASSIDFLYDVSNHKKFPSIAHVEVATSSRFTLYFYYSIGQIGSTRGPRTCHRRIDLQDYTLPLTTATISSSQVSASFLLSSSNAEAYTPTSNYNPATKKYVDDSITSAITNAIEGEY